MKHHFTETGQIVKLTERSFVNGINAKRKPRRAQAPSAIAPSAMRSCVYESAEMQWQAIMSDPLAG
jgi:hypothetical protein